MRRYKVVLTGPGTSPPTVTYDSQINGSDNVAALDVAFDVSVKNLGFAAASSYVEIFGLSLPDIAKVQQWQSGTLALYGGFSTGFPLAKANQYGLLATGTITQAFGNWTGTHQSAIFFLSPGPQNLPLVFFWFKGQKLSAAVMAAMRAAYPDITVKSYLKIDPIATETDLHRCVNIYDMADYIGRKTSALNPTLWPNGISIAFSNGVTLGIYDSGSINETITALDFNDLQGQPVYFGPGGNSIVQATLNLRADLLYASSFSFPTQATTGYLLKQPASTTVGLPQDNSIINGSYTITELRHVGRFRDPSGSGWITIVNANPLGGPNG